MSYQETITRRYAGAGRTLERAIAKTSGGKIGISESIPDSSTDLQIPLAIDVSQIKAIWIEAIGGNITVETNNGTTPDDTLSLTDQVPQLWLDTDIAACFLTTDVTDLFVTNASGAAVTLDLEVLYDPTV